MSSAADLDLLADLLSRAKRDGAEAADAVLVRSAGLAQAVRLGKPEKLEREESQDVGLRVLIGRRQAVVSTNDFSAAGLEALAERAVAMARVVPEDPWCGLAEPAQLASDIADLELCDPAEPPPALLLERATQAEEAARAVPGITNSEGAEAGWGTSRVALAASNGFAGAYALSSHSLSVAVIAGTGDGMERDYDYVRSVWGDTLEAPAAVGRRAGERSVRRLNPRKAETARLPVVYEPRVAGGLIGHLAGAVSGTAVARGTSFLKDKLGQVLFQPGVTIWDDPTRRRGHRSRPFDGEGLPARRRAVIDQGRLTGWTLDLATARQLGMASTGSAGRGTSAPPGPSVSNFYLAPGTQSPAALIGGIERGLYVTELMGMGVNGVTGDYSRGAAGFWIEKGELAWPVAEVTVAGNLKEMFLRLTPADDLAFRTGLDAPTCLVEGMTIAGR
jgi:PmbA protein